MIARISILIIALAISWSAFAHDEQYTIGIIGTGNMGSALGRGLAKSGHRVVYGSRSPSSDRVRALMATTGNDATATSQKEAAQQSDIIILAVPWLPLKSL